MKIRICFFASLILLIVLSQAVLAGDAGGTVSDHALDYNNPDNWVYYQVDADYVC